jgi:hypothetical protein
MLVRDAAGRESHIMAAPGLAFEAGVDVLVARLFSRLWRTGGWLEAQSGLGVPENMLKLGITRDHPPPKASIPYPAVTWL